MNSRSDPPTQGAVFPGSFVKACPCSPGAVSCGYRNANLFTGCPFDCSYCILQAYLPSRDPVFFRNAGEWERDLAEAAAAEPCLRIGTGELADSLALEVIRPLAADLLAVCARFPQVVFEFKTKSVEVSALLAAGEVLPNVVASWSLNPQTLIVAEEHRTPSLSERLAALEAVAAYGYRVGIHFDPLVRFPGWEEAYTGLITDIRARVRPDRIAWWSLGALRFPPALMEVLLRRETSLLRQELVPGFDGKFRYFKPRRLEMFARLVRTIRASISRDVPLYLCMEDDEVWREVLPERKAEKADLNRFLYGMALRR